MRNRSLAFLLAATGMLIATSVAVAGGWAFVTVTNQPVDPPVGEETSLNLNVLQHGVTPVSWPGLTVVATDEASGAVVRAEAKAVGPEGSYVATFVFPSAGNWILTFDSNDLVMEGSPGLGISVVAAAAPGAGAPAQGSQVAQPFDVMPLVLALLAAVAALVITGRVLHSRGAPAENRLSVRT